MEDKDKIQFFNDMMGKMNVPVKKLTGVAKFLTLAAVVLMLGFGILGSFDFAGFDMTKYTLFLDKFIWIISPLIVSVGAGTAVDKITEANKKVAEIATGTPPTPPVTPEVKK
jgi:hypothetical protein